MVLSGLTRGSSRPWAVVGVTVACLTAGVLALTHGSRPAHADPSALPHTSVEVSASRCGRGWTTPVSG
ncbi:EfeM/EfeO family lipoprotein, partial [Streptomyces sp. NPDC127079]